MISKSSKELFSPYNDSLNTIYKATIDAIEHAYKLLKANAYDEFVSFYKQNCMNISADLEIVASRIFTAVICLPIIDKYHLKIPIDITMDKVGKLLEENPAHALDQNYTNLISKFEKHLLKLSHLYEKLKYTIECENNNSEHVVTLITGCASYSAEILKVNASRVSIISQSINTIKQYTLRRLESTHHAVFTGDYFHNLF